MRCYISSVAMKGVMLRDDVRQSGVPFTMNQDGPEGSLGMCEGLGQASKAGMREGLGREPQPLHESCLMDFFREGELEVSSPWGSVGSKPERKAAARPTSAVRVKMEGEALAKLCPSQRKARGRRLPGAA